METIIYIKNMVCDRCIKVLKTELTGENIKVLDIKLGEITADIQTKKDEQTIQKVVESNGFYIIDGENFKLVEQTKLILINLLNNLPLSTNERLSEILSKEMYHEYSKISKIFSYNEKITIEKYFIKLKIEKAKELIHNRELNFTEISQLLNYSNLTHLSNQFKTETGMSLTEYKTMEKNIRNSLDQIY
ncbi:MAG TPA: AraC family transcriptional regulator [Leeuwenhoekiella sp.]|uniref:helix-turn-helix domain-containing protein n=1 Tax=Flavimarina sp. Hel_I_48 TaxID=1392488 RepID=UPI0004DFAFFB|nr:AraC family transcriptional regulator [Flavimarina sp. Hel_I_48]HEA30633.1 AraC family transcriptional regulator [Leeuwenhoekiella sp.]